MLAFQDFDISIVQFFTNKKKEKRCHFNVSPIFNQCRRPESNRYGRLVPQDFKSCASASSATAAYKMNRANSEGVVCIDAKHRVTFRDYTTCKS